MRRIRSAAGNRTATLLPKQTNNKRNRTNRGKADTRQASFFIGCLLRIIKELLPEYESICRHLQAFASGCQQLRAGGSKRVVKPLTEQLNKWNESGTEVERQWNTNGM